MLRNRILILVFISGSLVFLLLVRLFQIQVVQGDYWEQQAYLARFKRDPVPFHRGTIFDRYGKILASDVDRYDVKFSFRAFRRSHLLPQLTYLLSIVENRWVSLLEIAAEPVKSISKLTSLSPEDLFNLADSRSRGDAEFYLRRLLELTRVEQGRLKELLKSAAFPSTPIVNIFQRDPKALLSKLEAGLGNLALLERRVGWGKGLLLLWIEERRKLVERRVAERIKSLHLALSQVAKQERSLRRDYEARRVEVFREADYELAYFLTLHEKRFPGFFVSSDAERIYPVGVATPIIGLVQRPSDSDLKKTRKERGELMSLARIFDRTDAEQERFGYLLKSVPRAAYQERDRKGRIGLEAVFERKLRGRWGYRFVDDDRTGDLSIYLEDVPPLDGGDLVLTLCSQLQKVAEDALVEGYGSKKDLDGAIVILDVHRGEILAMASNPSFQVEDFRKRYAELVRDPRHPLHHRAYFPYQPPAPGSVFKLIVAVAALDNDIISPSYSSECLHTYKGLRCNDSGGGHGVLDLARAIEVSCNVYFYRLGEMVGVDALAETAENFGFRRPTGLELREVAGGVRRQPPDPRRFGIGQALIEVTPLQMARAYAALANGGYLVTPHLVRSVEDESRIPSRKSLGVSPEILAFCKEAMARVVGPGGTARPRAGWDLRPLGVVAKTGTAEVAKGIPDHAWFAGYLPAEAPMVSFCVYLERAGMHGGELAAPIAHRVLSSEPMRRYLAERR